MSEANLARSSESRTSSTSARPEHHGPPYQRRQRDQADQAELCISRIWGMRIKAQRTLTIQPGCLEELRPAEVGLLSRQPAKSVPELEANPDEQKCKDRGN